MNFREIPQSNALCYLNDFILAATSLSKKEEVNLEKILNILWGPKVEKRANEKFRMLKAFLTQREYKIAHYIVVNDATLLRCSEDLGIKYGIVSRCMNSVYKKTSGFIKYGENELKIKYFKEYYKG